MYYILIGREIRKASTLEWKARERYSKTTHIKGVQIRTMFFETRATKGSWCLGVEWADTLDEAEKQHADMVAAQ